MHSEPVPSSAPLNAPASSSFARSEDASALEHLRSRLLVYVGLITGVALLIVVVVVVAEWAFSMPSPWLLRPSGALHAGATLLLSGLLLALYKAPPVGWTLRAIDVVATLVIAVLAAGSTLVEVPRAAAHGTRWWWNPDQGHEMKSLLLLAHVLLLRAVVVPSRPRRTALIAVLAMTPICVTTGLGYAQTAMPPQYRTVPIVNAAVWAACTVAVSTACSSVIYGLRQKVRDAIRLGQYTLERKIGQGGMGVVFRARHALLRRPTAVKVLSADRVGEAMLERFEREVQLTAKLSHPNIVSIYDYGRSDDGTFYYAMEFLDGIDLEHLVELSGPQPPGRVIWILKQASEALAEAHAVRLIHRDIKPANMILSERASLGDVLKLVDFGLVKDLATGASAAASREQELRGTPLYMSPEAVLAPHSVGPASDLYALGAVGYFLLTGVPVFDGANAFTVLGKHAHAAPVPPSERADAVPKSLEAVILRCLEKEPASRYPDASALRDALDACDDVAPWTQSQAKAWWTDHRVSTRPLSLAPSSRLLTVDLRARARG